MNDERNITGCSDVIVAIPSFMLLIYCLVHFAVLYNYPRITYYCQAPVTPTILVVNMPFERRERAHSNCVVCWYTYPLLMGINKYFLSKIGTDRVQVSICFISLPLEFSFDQKNVLKK